MNVSTATFTETVDVSMWTENFLGAVDIDVWLLSYIALQAMP